MCITYPAQWEGCTFEIKSGLIHVLPTYHGSNGEDPNKFLSEFQVVCNSMKPTTAFDDVFELRAFPFPLNDATKKLVVLLTIGLYHYLDGYEKTLFGKIFTNFQSINFEEGN